MNSVSIVIRLIWWLKAKFRHEAIKTERNATDTTCWDTDDGLATGKSLSRFFPLTMTAALPSHAGGESDNQGNQVNPFLFFSFSFPICHSSEKLTKGSAVAITVDAHRVRVGTNQIDRGKTCTLFFLLVIAVKSQQKCQLYS